MASSTNLVVLLIALEIFSLPLYVLATWRRDERGFEAGLKYFLLGALSSAVFIYGIALYFGATGNLTAGHAGSGPLYAAAMTLMLAALGFKVSMVPFQWWTPDVYQGSPTSVALMMATAVKAAGFAAMARIFTTGGQGEWGLALGVVIACTVLFGNLGALVQPEAKRLLAYSSIAHAGYIGLALYSGTGGPAMTFYIFVYAAATGLAFAVLQGISEGDVPVQKLQGLLYRQPLLAVGLGVALLSLIGVPPFAGFWGKYLVFAEAAKAGQYGLVVLALLTSAIAAYYYLRLLGLAVLNRRGENTPAPSSTLVGVVIFSLTVLLLLSFVPGLGLNTFSVGQ
jgi:NADH-quinone oxidoreductase subunit N